MKGKKKYLIAIILLLAFGMIIDTFSIYRTSTTGNGSIETSTWSVNIKKNSSNTEIANLNFDYADINWTTHTGKNNKIAPGDTGYIDYTIDASGSEVDVYYEVEVGTITNAPATGFSAVADSASGIITYAAGANNMKKTIRITITWDGVTTDSNTKDESDKNANNKSMSIPVTIMVRQNL